MKLIQVNGNICKWVWVSSLTPLKMIVTLDKALSALTASLLSSSKDDVCALSHNLSI